MDKLDQPLLVETSTVYTAWVDVTVATVGLGRAASAGGRIGTQDFAGGITSILSNAQVPALLGTTPSPLVRQDPAADLVKSMGIFLAQDPGLNKSGLAG
jgi:hypothetical protein